MVEIEECQNDLSDDDDYLDSVQNCKITTHSTQNKNRWFKTILNNSIHTHNIYSGGIIARRCVEHQISHAETVAIR
jgi:hypothetical protein